MASTNSLTSEEWDTQVAVPPGTVLYSDLTEIIPRLFLSGLPGLFGPNGAAVPLGEGAMRWLHGHGIRTIVCCRAKDSDPRFSLVDVSDAARPSAHAASFDECEEEAFIAALERRRDDTVSVLNIPALDRDSFDLAAYFLLAGRVIRHSHDRGMGTLVHCVSGSSRSAAVLASYLVRRFAPHDSLPPERAPAIALAWVDAVLRHMERRRDCVNPNPGFRRQLVGWATEALWGPS